MDERITEIEIRISFLQKTVADLDEVVRALGDRMDAMHGELRGLQAELARDIELAKDLADEVPPHW